MGTLWRCPRSEKKKIVINCIDCFSPLLLIMWYLEYDKSSSKMSFYNYFSRNRLIFRNARLGHINWKKNPDLCVTIFFPQKESLYQYHSKKNKTLFSAFVKTWNKMFVFLLNFCCIFMPTFISSYIINSIEQKPLLLFSSLGIEMSRNAHIFQTIQI